MLVRIINMALVVLFVVAVVLGFWYVMHHQSQALAVVGAVVLCVWSARSLERVLPKFVRSALMRWRMEIYGKISRCLRKCPVRCISWFAGDFQVLGDRLWYLSSYGFLSVGEMFLCQFRYYQERMSKYTDWEKAGEREENVDVVSKEGEEEGDPTPDPDKKVAVDWVDDW